MFLFDRSSERWKLPASILGMALCVTIPGAFACAFIGRETLAAIFTCIWTSATLVAWGFSLQYHTTYEQTKKRESGKSLDISQYRYYNLMPKESGSSKRFRMMNQLHLRAVEYAKHAEKHFSGKIFLQGWGR